MLWFRIRKEGVRRSQPSENRVKIKTSLGMGETAHGETPNEHDTESDREEYPTGPSIGIQTVEKVDDHNGGDDHGL